METVLLIVCIAAGFVGMELASWFIHKYIMHGPLWNIHKTHHQHKHQELELNDVFTLFFGGIAVTLMIWGLETGSVWMVGLGSGISLYGFAYFVLHDLFIHRRIKCFKKSKSPFLNALAEAHHDHHKSREKNKSTSFGLLLINKKYFRKHYNRKKGKP